MGLETPDSGTILGLTNQRISAVFQEDRLCDNLSPVSNIRLTAGTHFPRRAITDALKPPHPLLRRPARPRTLRSRAAASPSSRL